MFTCIIVTYGFTDQEVETLLKFRDSLFNTTALNNWNKSSLCKGNGSNWTGVICVNDDFYGLQLENMGLKGIIDIGTLSELSSLRTVSFMNNHFEGPIPEIKKLGGALRGLFLSNNQFNGEIPDDAFDGMKSLTKVYLANNTFTGKLPTSLARLPKLLELWLENNQFEGQLPDFRSTALRDVNVANNKFEGPIPASLSNMSASFFSGNNLCDKPLDPCKSSKKKRSIPKIAIILVIVGVAALAAIVLASFLFRGRRRPKTSQMGKSSAAKIHKNDVQYKKAGSAPLPDHRENYNKKSENGKLYFVRNGRERFDLQDLLRASAEVLESGSFGSSYKALLLSGPAVVVKRFRQMSNVGKEEFHEHMRRLGSLTHPNLLPLVAFYYKKEEKLLITDFIENGSLASHLHSKPSPDQPALDWPTRLKIIKGVAKGLAYLHKELSALTLPHGHLKSSNVLLDDTFEPLLADYALAPVVNKDHAQQIMVAYKSPEFTQRDRTTKKTDVWSLGILILELLTGKFPANYLKQGKGANADLATWVNSVVREEWTGEVFDKEMKGTKNGEGEMLKLLKIGMCCCEWNVETRWDMWEAFEKIEELKERDADEEYSSYGSEGDVYSSRAVTEDDFSFSVTG
ncbi:hypothetical protein F0562_035541 [Nyssa sinensis]|uniref:non-specific serine/threonine protein kinase n=1 Tax=Nyssa sinensis TaxID=561372 RepID=A0A5J5ADI5_9ASTE|nr:hypothetical protein F0562_035541 [Nyssa sinensis]